MDLVTDSDALRRIQSRFAACSSPSISLDTFITEIGPLINGTLGRDQGALVELFHKIDINGASEIDWEQFADYLATSKTLVDPSAKAAASSTSTSWALRSCVAEPKQSNPDSTESSNNVKIRSIANSKSVITTAAGGKFVLCAGSNGGGGGGVEGGDGNDKDRSRGTSQKFSLRNATANDEPSSSSSSDNDDNDEDGSDSSSDVRSPTRTRSTWHHFQLSHHGAVEKVHLIPELDRIFTTGQDGTWRCWSASDYKHQRKVAYGVMGSRTVLSDGSRWVTDLCYLPTWKRFAVVCTHDSTVTLYDAALTGSKALERISTKLLHEGAPTCCASVYINDEECLAIGTTRGECLIMRRSGATSSPLLPKRVLQRQHSSVELTSGNALRAWASVAQSHLDGLSKQNSTVTPSSISPQPSDVLSNKSKMLQGKEDQEEASTSPADLLPSRPSAAHKPSNLAPKPTKLSTPPQPQPPPSTMPSSSSSNPTPPLEPLHHLHSDWITQIMYEPVTRCVVTSSLDSKIILYRPDTAATRLTFDGHKLGVRGFAYSPELGMCASYGLERRIQLWLLKSGVKVGCIDSLSASVQGCVIMGAQQLVVSLTADHAVQLWDLRTMRSIQTLKPEHFSLVDDRRVIALEYDNARQRLITLYNRPVGWALKSVSQDALGHAAPVTIMLYNVVFHAIVSCDEQGTVVVWSCRTGRPTNRVENCHDGLPIIAAAFDHSQRKLFTGSSLGNVRCWNFYNGQLLREFVQDSGPIHMTQLKHIVDERRGIRRVIITGWKGKVIAWEELSTVKSSRQTEHRMLEGHTSDVLSLSYDDHGMMLLTGDFEGKIIIWSSVTLVRHRVIRQWFGASPVDNAVEALIALPPARARRRHLARPDAVSRDAVNVLLQDDAGGKSMPDLGPNPSTWSVAKSKADLNLDIHSDLSGATIQNASAIFAADTTTSLDEVTSMTSLLDVPSALDIKSSSFAASAAATSPPPHPSYSSPHDDSPLLVSCSGDGKILIWELGRSSTRIAAIIRGTRGRFSAVSSLSVDPSLRYLVVGDTTGMIKVFLLDHIYQRVMTGAVLKHQLPHESSVEPIGNFVTEDGAVVRRIEVYATASKSTSHDKEDFFITVSHGGQNLSVYTLDGRLVGKFDEEARPFSLSDPTTWTESAQTVHASERRQLATWRDEASLRDLAAHGPPPQAEVSELMLRIMERKGMDGTQTGGGWVAEGGPSKSSKSLLSRPPHRTLTKQPSIMPSLVAAEWLRPEISAPELGGGMGHSSPQQAGSGGVSTAALGNSLLLGRAQVHSMVPRSYGSPVSKSNASPLSIASGRTLLPRLTRDEEEEEEEDDEVEALPSPSPSFPSLVRDPSDRSVASVFSPTTNNAASSPHHHTSAASSIYQSHNILALLGVTPRREPVATKEDWTRRLLYLQRHIQRAKHHPLSHSLAHDQKRTLDAESSEASLMRKKDTASSPSHHSSSRGTVHFDANSVSALAVLAAEEPELVQALGATEGTLSDAVLNLRRVTKRGRLIFAPEDAANGGGEGVEEKEEVDPEAVAAALIARRRRQGEYTSGLRVRASTTVAARASAAFPRFTNDGGSMIAVETEASSPALPNIGTPLSAPSAPRTSSLSSPLASLPSLPLPLSTANSGMIPPPSQARASGSFMPDKANANASDPPPVTVNASTQMALLDDMLTPLQNRTVCLSTLHNYLDIYAPISVPETLRDLKARVAKLKSRSNASDDAVAKSKYFVDPRTIGTGEESSSEEEQEGGWTRVLPRGAVATRLDTFLYQEANAARKSKHKAARATPPLGGRHGKPVGGGPAR